MKRTKQINHVFFHKHWRTYPMAPVALIVGAFFILAGCEKRDENVSSYMNSDDCTPANFSLSEQCSTLYNSAQQESIKTVPKYASRAACIAEFGENQCTHVPAQIGMSAESQHNNSMWMPLIAGYMMGRMMEGGYAQQPLFTSNPSNNPVRGRFVDVNDRGYGATGGLSIKIPKTVLPPKPATTQTITRGGFGDTGVKQRAMRSNSATPHRIMGG